MSASGTSSFEADRSASWPSPSPTGDSSPTTTTTTSSTTTSAEFPLDGAKSGSPRGDGNSDSKSVTAPDTNSHVLQVRQILVDFTRLAREHAAGQPLSPHTTVSSSTPPTSLSSSPPPPQDRVWAISDGTSQALFGLGLLPLTALAARSERPDFSPYLHSDADIDPPLVVGWLIDHARLEYYPDQNLLRLRMPSIAHDQTTSEVTRLLHAEFCNALNASALTSFGKLVTRQGAYVELSSSCSLSPDNQLAWSYRKHPALVVETEWGHELPRDKPFKYINETDAQIRTVLVLHVEFKRLSSRRLTEPEEQQQLALSLYRVKLDGVDEEGNSTSDTFEELYREPIHRDAAPPILTLPLSCLHEDLPDDLSISVQNQQLYSIVDEAFQAQRRVDL